MLNDFIAIYKIDFGDHFTFSLNENKETQKFKQVEEEENLES